MHRLHAILIPCCVLLWAATAHSGTVAIIRSRHPSAALTEAWTRLHGELLSVGLQVKMLDRPVSRSRESADPAWLERVATDGGLDAMIEVAGDDAPFKVDVWVLEKTSSRAELSRVAVEASASDDGERLAIRAVEALRSTFLEREMIDHERRLETSQSQSAASRTKQTTPPPLAAPKSSTAEMARLARGETANGLPRVSVEVGVAMLTGLGGVGSAVLPVARAAWMPRPRLALQVTAAGFGTRPMLETSAGKARVSQQFATLGGSYRMGSGNPWPFVSLSAGVLHSAFEGQADLPSHGRALDQWSFLLDGGLGAGLRLLGHYYLMLSMHAQLAEPYVAVHFVDRVVAKTGRPNLLMSLTIGTCL